MVPTGHPLPTLKEERQERKEEELAHVPTPETWAVNLMRFLLPEPEGQR